MAKSREQVPISFNMNDPIEREIYNWLEKMRSKTNKKGNISAVIKKILFNYIEREKEREYVKNKLMLMELEDKEIGLSRGREIELSYKDNAKDENMEIDSDSLPF